MSLYAFPCRRSSQYSDIQIASIPAKSPLAQSCKSKALAKGKTILADSSVICPSYDAKGGESYVNFIDFPADISYRRIKSNKSFGGDRNIFLNMISNNDFVDLFCTWRIFSLALMMTNVQDSRSWEKFFPLTYRFPKVEHFHNAMNLSRQIY